MTNPFRYDAEEKGHGDWLVDDAKAEGVPGRVALPAGVRAALGTFLRDLCTILPRHHDRHRTMLADAQRAR